MSKLPFSILNIEYVGLDHFGKCGDKCAHRDRTLYKIHAAEDKFRFEIMCKKDHSIVSSRGERWIISVNNPGGIISSINALVKKEILRIIKLLDQGGLMEHTKMHWDSVERRAFQEGLGYLCAIETERRRAKG